MNYGDWFSSPVLLLRILAICGVFFTSPIASAIDINRINPAGGLWGNAADWNPAQVPLATDRAIFGLPGAYTVFNNVLNVGPGEIRVDQGEVRILMGASFSSGLSPNPSSIGGAGPAAKMTITGPGNWMLSTGLDVGANGTLINTINAPGSLGINGGLGETLDIAVGGSLFGTGVFQGGASANRLANSGVISAGAGPGLPGLMRLDHSGLNNNSNGTFRAEIGGVFDGSQYDRVLTLNGSVTVLDGTLDVDLINGFIPSAGDTFVIIQGDGTSTFLGTFATTDLPPLLSPLQWTVEYTTNDVKLLVSNVVIPEPSSWLLGGISTVSMAVAVIRKRRRSR